MSSDPVGSARPDDAHAAAAWRVGAVTALWFVLRVGMSPQDHLVKLALDAGLALGAWWALTPGRRGGGPEFLRTDHWTKFLSVPFLVGAFLTVYDLLAIARQ